MKKLFNMLLFWLKAEDISSILRLYVSVFRCAVSLLFVLFIILSILNR